MREVKFVQCFMLNVTQLYRHREERSDVAISKDGIAAPCGLAMTTRGKVVRCLLFADD